MATNDNTAMVEAAREMCRQKAEAVREFSAPVTTGDGSKLHLFDLMADFALSREAEIRRQIADELEAILSAKLDRGDWLANIWTYIEKLRGNK